MTSSKLIAAPLDQTVLKTCQAARAFEEAGEYEKARQALEGLWQRIGERPATQKLSRAAAAALLLRVGRLSSWIGSTQDIEGAQEFAKDLLTEALQLFKGLKDRPSISETLNALGICYWREASFAEARIHLKEAISHGGEPSSEQSLTATINLAMVEYSDGNYEEAFSILGKVAPRLNEDVKHVIRARFKNELTLVKKKLGRFDEALIDCSEASYHFEQAGHFRNMAHTENNLGDMLLVAGRYDDALQHLAHALQTFERLNDRLGIALVSETQARVLLRTDSWVEAEKSARRAVQAVEDGDDYSTLIENLTTHGTTLSRLGRHVDAIAQYLKAHELALDKCGTKRAAQVALVMTEEIVAPVYRDAGIPFEVAAHRFGGALIRGALVSTGWRVGEAEFKLGLKRGALSWKLKYQYQNIQSERPHVKTRRPSVVKSNSSGKAQSSRKVVGIKTKRKS